MSDYWNASQKIIIWIKVCKCYYKTKNEENHLEQQQDIFNKKKGKSADQFVDVSWPSG